MRSRAARLTLSAIAWIALGAAAFFIVTTEQRITERRNALRTFDVHAREAAFALADARAGQQAYVAAGQSSTYWVPKVATLVQDVTNTVDVLRGTAVSTAAGQALLDGSAALTEFGNVDKRVRDYLSADESLMASDVAFSEGSDAAGRAALQVETARIAEHQAFDADEAALHRLEAYAIGGSGALTALILAIFGLARAPKVERSQPTEVATPADVVEGDELPIRETSLGRLAAAPPEATHSDPSSASASTVALRDAAALCTEFGRVHDLADLKILLGRAAYLLDATGLVVWLGNPAGADLQPVIAHGYSDQVLALMRPVPRSADNAAATAYRCSEFQIVPSRSGVSLGAVAAPLLSADGCIGALTAEIRHGHETSSHVQSLASIFAAQLAGALAAAPAASNTKAAVS
jgi:hypothetical protein